MAALEMFPAQLHFIFSYCSLSVECVFISVGLVANGKRSNLSAKKLQLNICRISWIWNTGTEEVVGIRTDKL